jgi:hypothetical protein
MTTHHLPGLDAPVTLRIDRWGMAHIRAQGLKDLFFAQGFNAARDRLWQIDLWRKRGLGLLAADFGPDGRFYVLERDFRARGGFSSRLRRFELGTDGLTGEAILIETPFALHDNLEGLSVWRDDQGVLRATMISDDNFIFVQQTQIFEYRLPD